MAEVTPQAPKLWRVWLSAFGSLLPMIPLGLIVGGIFGSGGGVSGKLVHACAIAAALVAFVFVNCAFVASHGQRVRVAMQLFVVGSGVSLPFTILASSHVALLANPSPVIACELGGLLGLAMVVASAGIDVRPRGEP